MKVARGVHSAGTPSSGGEPDSAPRSFEDGILVLVALLLFATLVFVVPYVPAVTKQGADIFSQLASTLPGGSQVESTTSTLISTTPNPQCDAVATNHTPAPPDIGNGSADVWYPNDYCSAVSYMLTVINQDRATNSTAPVSLDYNRAAQQHADSMLYYGYFSHFDTQGYKPYMRYTLLGGLGADFENVAIISYRTNHFTSIGAVEQATSLLEHSMMYNDSVCCQNGHRDNILNVLHNKVSLGIAYNGTTLLFDEEFENEYISLNFSVSTSTSSNPYYVTMTGTPTRTGPSPTAIFIGYDSLPSPESAKSLNNGPTEYTPGTLIGGALPPRGYTPSCGYFTSGITVCADTWVYSTSRVDIAFSLKDFVAHYGPGVYTVYLVTGSDTNTALTTISIFVP